MAFKIKTPHAAVIIWNYDDRIDESGEHDVDSVNTVLVSTVSLVNINTNKSKSSPNGTFTFSLAPTKNWVSTITPGSWCAILMSNNPISPQDLRKADSSKVKMIGKIETVRLDARQDADGGRETQYLVSGSDWGTVFNNIIYIDPYIGNEQDAKTQGEQTFMAIRDSLFDKTGHLNYPGTPVNIQQIISIMGKTLTGIDKEGSLINRVASAAYGFSFPKEMCDYFDFISPEEQKSLLISRLMTFYYGTLKEYDEYDFKDPSIGFLNPYSLQGTHTFWQIMQDNACSVLNELFCDLKWESQGLRLGVYNRIRPFVVKGKSELASPYELRSFFQNVPYTEIPADEILTINVGTNWRDKYNFVEIKPDIENIPQLNQNIKVNSQKADVPAFQREGMRPLIMSTRQIPTDYKVENISGWSNVNKDWHFETHKMLNGSLTFAGPNDYIGVGENILIDANAINATPNFNSAAVNKGSNGYMLAHVENISHSFVIGQDAARQYLTTIQFVRGIFVDESLNILGEGTLDNVASNIDQDKSLNSDTVIAPDRSKITPPEDGGSNG